MRPEPKNEADENAIAVYSERGVQMGYVSAERAPLIGQRMRTGLDIVAIFQAATQFGAVIRVGFDGEAPVLPPPLASASEEEFAGQQPGQDWWPDPEWPD